MACAASYDVGENKTSSRRSVKIRIESARFLFYFWKERCIFDLFELIMINELIIELIIWTHNDTEDVFVGIRSATGNAPLRLRSDFLWLHSLPKVERVIPSCFWTVIIISPSLPEVLYLADMFLAVLLAIFFTMLKVVLWDPYKEKKNIKDRLAGRHL